MPPFSRRHFLSFLHICMKESRIIYDCLIGGTWYVNRIKMGVLKNRTDPGYLASMITPPGKDYLS